MKNVLEDVRIDAIKIFEVIEVIVIIGLKLEIVKWVAKDEPFWHVDLAFITHLLMKCANFIDKSEYGVLFFENELLFH